MARTFGIVQEKRERVFRSHYLRMITRLFKLLTAHLDGGGDLMRTPRRVGVKRGCQAFQAHVERIEKYQSITTQQCRHHPRECLTISAAGLPCVMQEVPEIRYEL